VANFLVSVFSCQAGTAKSPQRQFCAVFRHDDEVLLECQCVPFSGTWMWSGSLLRMRSPLAKICRCSRAKTRQEHSWSQGSGKNGIDCRWDGGEYFPALPGTIGQAPVVWERRSPGSAGHPRRPAPPTRARTVRSEQHRLSRTFRGA